MRKLLWFLLILGSWKSLRAQRHTAEFPNGTKLDYEIVSDSYLKAPRFNISAESYTILSDAYLLYFASACYSHPGLFVLRFHYSLPEEETDPYTGQSSTYRTGFYAEGYAVLYSMDTPKPKKFTMLLQTQQGYGASYKYKVKHPISRKIQIGPHLGIHHQKYSTKFHDVRMPMANEYEVGLSYNIGRHVHAIVNRDNKNIRLNGGTSFRVNYDFVYYDYQYSDSIPFQFEPRMPKAGWRLYAEHKWSLWGRWSWTVFLGGGIGSYKLFDHPYYMFNGGIGLSF